MTTYFAWGRESASFNANEHSRQDLEIFKLDITQNEGEVAVARALIPENSNIPIRESTAFISYQKGTEIIPLFKGQLMGLPIKITPGLVFIEFIALPRDVDQKISKAVKNLKKEASYEPLFHDEQSQNDLSSLLESKSVLFYWDRVSGEQKLSNLFQGYKTLDLTEWVLEDSLKIHFTQVPLSEVQINLSCEWVQNSWGEINIGPKLHHYFGDGLISTLTPEDLEARWPKAGKTLGRSGYEILESSLKRVVAANLNSGKKISSFTPPLKINCEKTNKKKTVWLERVWYKAKLVLGWNYQQKRQETAQIIVRQKSALTKWNHKKKREINIKLQNVFPNNKGEIIAGSFFDTERGKRVIDSAIDIGMAHLAGSARCIEVSFQIPFEAALDITTDHNIVLKADWVPGGMLDAKVVGYGLCQNGLQAHGWVKLHGSPGVNEKWPSDNQTALTAVSEDKNGKKVFSNAHGIKYSLSIEEPDEEPFSKLNGASTEIFIEELLVEGAAQEQVIGIQECARSIDNIQDYLKNNPTSFCLKLKDLRTLDVIRRNYYIDVLTSWSAPAQINYNFHTKHDGDDYEH